MRHKNSNLYGNWYISSGERSASSKQVYKNYATTSMHRREMEELAVKKIIDDIYLRALPRVTRKLVREVGCDEIEKEIKDFIVPQYGRKNIIYDILSHPEERLPRQSVFLGNSMFVAPEGYRKGMPIWEFIKWYSLWNEDGCSKIAEAIEEWSGIPAYLHRATYNAIVDYLRSCAQKEHDNEDKYSSGEIRVKLYLGF